jgi:thymidylate synthase
MAGTKEERLMLQYQNLLQRALEYGDRKVSRGYQTRSLFAEFLHFDLRDGFPLVTTKHVSFYNVKHELLWMLSGEVHLDYLHRHKVHIWDKWQKADGTIGPGYGYQWRHWPEGLPEELGQTYMAGEIDQVAAVIEALKTDPGSRRMVVSAWNVADLPQMALPPCHMLWVANVNHGAVNVHVTLRSSDLFVGLPYNIAQYALLTHLLAYVTDREAGEVAMTLVDAHLYEAHVEAAQEQLTRTPYPLPRLVIAPNTPRDIDSISGAQLTVAGYQSHPGIRVEVME